MARIAGVNIPTNKRVIVALTYIHGIGPTTARKIADKLGIDHSRRVQDLTDQEVLQIRETIDSDYSVEGDLRRDTAMNIKRLMDLACYRGLRHPVDAAGCPGHRRGRQQPLAGHATGRGEAIDAEREGCAFAPMSAVDGAAESP